MTEVGPQDVMVDREKEENPIPKKGQTAYEMSETFEIKIVPHIDNNEDLKQSIQEKLNSLLVVDSNVAKRSLITPKLIVFRSTGRSGDEIEKPVLPCLEYGTTVCYLIIASTATPSKLTSLPSKLACRIQTPITRLVILHGALVPHSNQYHQLNEKSFQDLAKDISNRIPNIKIHDNSLRATGNKLMSWLQQQKTHQSQQQDTPQSRSQEQKILQDREDIMQAVSKLREDTFKTTAIRTGEALARDLKNFFTEHNKYFGFQYPEESNEAEESYDMVQKMTPQTEYEESIASAVELTRPSFKIKVEKLLETQRNGLKELQRQQEKNAKNDGVQTDQNQDQDIDIFERTAKVMKNAFRDTVLQKVTDLKNMMDNDEIETFEKTSGGTGEQQHIPSQRDLTTDEMIQRTVGNASCSLRDIMDQEFNNLRQKMLARLEAADISRSELQQ